MTIRKYQAFISSTFRDLHDARERVTWEVLKIGFIPVGMENFSAMDERGWATIAKAIDQSDYYVVIVAGLYGSVDESGKSWTEREYEHARGRGVPVLAFIRELREAPGDMVEKGEAAAKLDMFIAKLRGAHHVEAWTTVDDLRAKVPVALMKIAREDESEGSERPGWYRGAGSATALNEWARLSAENHALREQLAAVGSSPPAPQLGLRIRQERGNPGIHRSSHPGGPTFRSRWYHLRVWNNNRSASIAHGARVLLSEIWEKRDGRLERIWEEEVPMKWTHHEGAERTIGAPADADLCWLMQGESVVRLATRATPFSMPTEIPPRAARVLVFCVRAHEIDSDRFSVEVSWDGLFSESEAEMAQHLIVRPTSDPLSQSE